MRKSTVRIVAGTALALVAVAVTGGIASAAPAVTAPAAPAAVASPDTSIWLLPGVDLGPVLDPTVGIPAQVFGPVDGLLTFVGG